MDYEILKNSMDFVYENIIPLGLVTTGLFALVTGGYFVKEYKNHEKTNKDGDLEQKTNYNGN